MRRINFAKTNSPEYSSIIDSHIGPIARYLPNALINSGCMENAINVVYFREWHHYSGQAESVFIPHGIADKGYRNGNVVDKFDYVGVSGPAWRDKLIREGVDPEKILIIGYPYMDSAFNGELERKPSVKTRILWAPTHGHTAGLSSDPDLFDVLLRLPVSCEVVLTPHPANKAGLPVSLQALMNADVVIADSGSTIYEAWALGIPVVFPDYLIKDHVNPDTFEGQIYAEGLGHHATSEEHLLELVQTVAGQPLDDAVTSFIDGIFPPELRGVSGLAAAHQLERVAAAPSRLPARIDRLYDNRVLWQMSPAERSAIRHLISLLPKKQCAIEIGSYKGGFLRVLSAEFEQVLSCDINHDNIVDPAQYTNVWWVGGDSKETLRPALEQVREQIDFILIDGDHTTAGVAADIANVLSLKPDGDVIVLIHDAWYPPSRAAIDAAEWGPHVHLVDKDFVPGDLIPTSMHPSGFTTIGGLCFVLLRAEEREEPLDIQRSHDEAYQRLQP